MTEPTKNAEENPSNTQNEGEGSRSAARRYDAGVERTVKAGKVEEAAKEAEEALEGDEGDELRRAEEQGKKAQHK